MGFADLHIHTIHSFDGTASVSAVLRHVAKATDLKVIAITDHNSMSGIPEALEIAPKYGVEVIPGCEISTAQGHLLALFIERPVEQGLSLVKTVQLVAEQGGICIAADPMAKAADSLHFHIIQHALLQPQLRKTLVGIEAFNGSLVYTKRNPLVEALSMTLPLAQVGNSDSHILETIGQGSTYFPGETAADLRLALETRNTTVRKDCWLSVMNMIRTYLPRYFIRKLGWVKFNPAPDAPLTYTRLQYALKPVYVEK